LPADAKFCLECGHPVQEPPPPPTARDPHSYTPKHLAEKILSSRAALEGERKQVTVLFADVCGSMELQEQVDPEEWLRIMDGFFAVLSDGVHRFEGTVIQFTGDGIMALFGAPIAHEDHAQRACYTALKLKEDVRRYAEEVQHAHGLGFSARLGLNSGEVVVGTIGDDLRMDYTALGHTVGLAQRMEALAEPGTTYLSNHTAMLVSGFFELDDLGEFDIKGVQDQLKVYSLLGPYRTHLDLSLARGLTPFVGRDAEMQTLHSALDRARDSKGHVVGIVAQAGTGKSRLCYEFVQKCRDSGTRVYEAHGLAHGKGIPFLPVLQLFRHYFDITEQDTNAQARQKIADQMLWASMKRCRCFTSFSACPIPNGLCRGWIPKPGSGSCTGWCRGSRRVARRRSLSCWKISTGSMRQARGLWKISLRVLQTPTRCCWRASALSSAPTGCGSLPTSRSPLRRLD
jgi:class 3 adenylate cyclase